MVADPQADEYIRRQERLKSYRSNFEYTWHEIARRIMPRADEFLGKQSPGTRRERYIFDSTAQLALPAFAAAMESMLTPRMSKWHSLKPTDPDLQGDDEILAYLEAKRDILFRLRYSPKANFASQAYEVYQGLGAFGTGGLFVEDALAKGIRYRSVPLTELYIEEDHYGMVDGVHRRYMLTARQAMAKFRKDGTLPEAIVTASEKEPEREFEFLHCVVPNEERKADDNSYRGMAYAAYDISIEGRRMLRVGGYRTKPYAVSRYVTAPREIYGRSPAWDALADIQTINEMSKTLLRHGQLVTDPAWATADVDSMSPFAMRPGAINAGYMNDRGEILAKSLAPEGNPAFGLEMQDQRRQSINRSFLITLFQILVDTPTMTATEAMLRAQEKGALLAPTVGRQQSEFLGVIIERELDIMTAAGLFDDMPDKLRRSGGLVEVEYDSPLSRAQRSEETAGIMQLIEAVTPLAQIDQSILSEFNAGRTLRRLRDGFGAPTDVLNTDDEMAQVAQAKQADEQAQNLIQAAPVAAGAVKDLADAAAKSQQAPF